MGSCFFVILGIVLLVVGFIFLVVIGLIRRSVRKEKESCFMSTSGYFIGQSYNSPVTDSTTVGDIGVFGVYSYTVNDKEYFVTRHDRYHNYETDVIISYNPSDPSKAYIEGEEDSILKIITIVFRVLGFTLLIGGAIVVALEFILK